jgi:hypothetical protein
MSHYQVVLIVVGSCCERGATDVRVGACFGTDSTPRCGTFLATLPLPTWQGRHEGDKALRSRWADCGATRKFVRVAESRPQSFAGSKSRGEFGCLTITFYATCQNENFARAPINMRVRLSCGFIVTRYATAS